LGPRAKGNLSLSAPPPLFPKSILALIYKMGYLRTYLEEEYAIQWQKDNKGQTTTQKTRKKSNMNAKESGDELRCMRRVTSSFLL
jgi:hypothetical protein